MRFKIGDVVRINPEGNFHRQGGGGTGVVINTKESGLPYRVRWEHDNENTYGEHDLILAKKGKYMGRRTFRLLKDTPELKKGAVVQEKCDDGDQDYVVLEKHFQKFPDQKNTCYTRNTVEKQPKYFVEVFPIAPEWATKDEMAKFKKYMARGKK